MARQRPPTIVHVIHSLEGGGTERMLVALLRRFDPLRARHVVITLREAGSLAAHLPDHVACRAIGAKGRSWTAGLKLGRYARQWHASVIHARNTGCWSDATVAGVMTPEARLVLGFHGLQSGTRFAGRQRRVARRGLFAGARFTSVSGAGSRQLQRQVGIPAARIDVLANGVDLERFTKPAREVRRAMRSCLRLGDSSFVVGIVGSLTRVKRHDLLISAAAKAAAAIPTLHLVVVGDGPLRGVLEDRARAEGVAERVHFTGWREDVPDILAGMDAYACCSESEGMNNALLEAMAVGLPSVATDVGDNGIVLRDRLDGILVKPKSVSAIVDALNLLAANPALRREMGRRAAERANEYTIGSAVNAYEQYYLALAGGRSAKRRDEVLPGFQAPSVGSCRKWGPVGNVDRDRRRRHITG